MAQTSGLEPVLNPDTKELFGGQSQKCIPYFHDFLPFTPNWHLLVQYVRKGSLRLTVKHSIPYVDSLLRNTHSN